MAPRFDFTITRGIKRQLPLVLIGCRLPCSLAACGRGALNLRGYTFKLEIIRGGLSTEVVDTLSTENGRITLNRKCNALSLAFPPEATSVYPRYSVPYRLMATYEKGTSFEQTYVLLFGEINIKG